MADKNESKNFLEQWKQIDPNEIVTKTYLNEKLHEVFAHYVAEIKHYNEILLEDFKHTQAILGEQISHHSEKLLNHDSRISNLESE
jgi:hypothetical protein